MSSWSSRANRPRRAGIAGSITPLSEIEEARALQYQCECIETACLDHGVDLQDPRVLDVLKHHYHRDQAPDGYAAWLDRNIAQYDPVARAFRLRDSLPLGFRTHHSFKCWDDRCMHYIYGYPHRDDRDQHSKEHVVPRKRDSGLSVGGTPPLVLNDHPTRNQGTDHHHGKQTSSPLYLPRPTGSFQLAPLATGSQHAREHRDSLRSYSFVSEYPAGPRGSVDSEVDPLLPPLKRSRVGQSRLESIEELRLLRDIGPCLRCKILQKSVSEKPNLPAAPESPRSATQADSHPLPAHSATRMTHAASVPMPQAPRAMISGGLSAASEGRSLPLPISCFQVRDPPALDLVDQAAFVVSSLPRIVDFVSA